jgi:hypothetical protein
MRPRYGTPSPKKRKEEVFMLDDRQLGEIMGLIADSDEYTYDAAKKWVHEHPGFVQEWIKQLDPCNNNSQKMTRGRPRCTGPLL